MKKIILSILAVCLIMSFGANLDTTYCDSQNNDLTVKMLPYIVYDIDKGTKINEYNNIQVGDEFLTKNFELYKIIEVNHIHQIGRAKFIEKVERPKVRVNYTNNGRENTENIIGLYCTHNAESYLIGDGVDSYYGKGGIHDVANSLKNNFEKLGVKVYFDQSLHLPHDSYAYSKSQKTASNLINSYKPDAIFDIHRDAISRSTYVTKVNGVDRCKVRIVVGKASQNFEIADTFAKYLLAVGDSLYDWLFLDIYYATGHYNQGLYDKALLFEMGSHLVEKDLVIDSTNELAEIISVALFNTTVNDNTGDLTVNGNQGIEDSLVNDSLSDNSLTNENITNHTNSNFKYSSVILSMVIISLIITYLIIQDNHKHTVVKNKVDNDK